MSSTWIWSVKWITRCFARLKAGPAISTHSTWGYNMIHYCQSFETLSDIFFHQIIGVDDTGLQTTNSISLSMGLLDDNEYHPVVAATYNLSIAENSAFGTNVGSAIVCQSLYECHTDTIE